jgi:hypothetical protein
VAVFEVDPWDLVETVRERLLALDCDLANAPTSWVARKGFSKEHSVRARS